VSAGPTVAFEPGHSTGAWIQLELQAATTPSEIRLNLADGDKLSGAIRQVGRTYRLSAPLYF